MSIRTTDMSRRAALSLLAGAGTGLVGFSPAAQAQAYPDRPVKLLVPFAAGGPTDVMARLLATKMSEDLGKQFYVDNQGGAGGNIGMATAAHSPPDGLTVLVVSSSFVINPASTPRSPTTRSRTSSRSRSPGIPRISSSSIPRCRRPA